MRTLGGGGNSVSGICTCLLLCPQKVHINIGLCQLGMRNTIMHYVRDSSSSSHGNDYYWNGHLSNGI